MMSGIYRIRNLVNGKVYVGSAKNLNKRWRDHRLGLEQSEHPNRHLQSGWDKHGESAFVFEVMEKVEPENLVEREQFYLDQVLETGNHYNICLVAGSKLGVECPEGTRRKIGEANRGKIRSDETRKSISIGHKGKKFTDEHKEKISAALKGRRLSEETKAKLSGEFSEEHRRNLSLNHKTRKTRQL